MKQLWLSILAVGILGSPAAMADEASYHVSAFLFDTQQNCKFAGECEGSAEVCKCLFMPPQVYDGRYIPIPKSATVFGVVIVTHKKTSKIIPLFRWSDDKGKTRCACNGPTPWYARQEDSEEKLLKSILEAIKPLAQPVMAQRPFQNAEKHDLQGFLGISMGDIAGKKFNYVYASAV